MPARKGAAHHNAKMNTRKVKAARKAYETGKWTISALARKYEITRQSMHAILTGETWKHLL
jgi:DNA-binding XRE family transcriptional regulator